MARAFMRQVAWGRSVEMRVIESGALLDPLVREAEEDDKAMWLDALYGDEAVSQYAHSQRSQGLLNDIAGGSYWETIVDDETTHWEERVSRLVDKYREKLRGWFRLVEALPVRPDASPIPKYWIVFMSRYKPAFDLFNSAACDMVRAQDLNIMNKPGGLFAGLSIEAESPPPQVVDRAVKRAAQPLVSYQWNELRWRTCGNRNVGKFTEGEVNQSIKRLLRAGFLSGASGDKVEETTVLSPTEQLKSWRDR